MKPGAVLVLRTPNALFYRACQRRLQDSPDSDLAVWIVRALGYNNLLAFPYLYGYDSDALIAIAGDHGFHRQAALNSELITLPFPRLDDWIVDENRAANAMLQGWSELRPLEDEGRLTAPWMEVIFRAD